MNPRPIPAKSWKPEYGWGYTLYTADNRKLHRSGGMKTRGDALAHAEIEMRSGRYEKAWIYELNIVEKVTPIAKRPPPKDDHGSDRIRGF